MDHHAPLVGRTLGHYRLEEEIGAGGMGVVYRARDERLDRDVAVKVLPSSLLAEPAARRRFRQEALALSRLNHPHVETVFDFHNEEGLDYLVIEYIPGVTLRSMLAAGPLPESEILRLGTQASEGLAAAHAQGVVHRDIKADNLRVTPEGRLKILDFGLASVTRPPGETELTRSVTVVPTVSGTLPYMAPEQLEGQLGDTRSDVYALGVALYEMATGRRPFEASVPTALVGEILRKQPAPPREVNPALSPELNAIILKCLQKDAAERYASAGELQADLQRLQAGSAVRAAVPVGHAERRPWRRSGVLVTLGLVIVAVAATLAWRLWYPAPVLAAGDRLLLAHFTAPGNEAALAGALRTAVATKLTESPFLSLVSDGEIAETLPLMRKPATEPIVGAVVRDVCRRVGARAFLGGDVVRPGGSYVVDLHVVGCDTGADLAVSQAQGDTYAALTGDLDVKLRALRRRLGEALASIQQHDEPLERVTTASIEALTAYSDAERIRLGGSEQEREAIPFYQRAIALDPDFAMAHRALGAIYSNVRMSKESTIHRQRAYELRERLTERERLMVTTQYFLFVDYHFSRALDALNQLRAAYPNEAWGHYQFGQLCRLKGSQEEALAAFRQAARAEPRSPRFKAAVSGALFTVGRFDEALAASSDPEVTFLVRFVRDEARMAEAIPGWNGPLALQAEAMAAASRGQLNIARDRFREAASSLNAGWARDAQATAAWWEAELGNPARARELATPLGLAAGQAWLTLGDLAWLARIEEFFSRETDADRNPLFVSIALPRARAAVAVAQGRLAQAIELLRVPPPYEYGTILVSPSMRAPFLHENSLGVFHQRGQVYLMLKDGSKAAADFQQILDHPGLGPLTPAYALAPLNLGRAYALMGDRARARAAYERFLDRWREADPDVPVLLAARKEYARLQ